MMGQRRIIDVRGAVVSDPAKRLAKPINFSLNEGEHIAVIGLNGAGKSLMLETIAGHLHLKEGTIEFDFGSQERSYQYSEQIKYITFRDSYGGAADNEYYHQQRWNSYEQIAPTVAELLGENPDNKELLSTLGIDQIYPKQITLLSSGELRKLQIAKMLQGTAQLLIIESPYIGLDATARELFTDILNTLAQKSRVQIILSVATTEDIPQFITHIYSVKDKSISTKQTREEFFKTEEFSAQLAAQATRLKEGISLPAPLSTPLQSNQIIQMNGVSIRYGQYTLLKDVDWSVNRGERWALKGSNGSGKSTLLSLVCADNPQAYSQDITLFGRRRGSGESIWDIKKHIGYISPEMHRSYIKDIPAIDIVASGFFDSVGLYFTPDDNQRRICMEWLRLFDMAKLSNHSFVKLSSGEQRLLLLIRAFVKDPDLLILDEPLHGLDCIKKEFAKQVINTFCSQKDKTLIYVTHYEQELPECITHQKILKKL